jgi:ATP-binding cassette subfamily F protein 3
MFSLPMCAIRSPAGAALRGEPRHRYGRRMSLLTLQNVGFDFGSHTVFDGLNLTVNTGERYGLVGVNGAGKSTLLRLIAGELQPERGRVERSARVRIGYLEQDTELRSQRPLRTAVRQEAFGSLLAIEQRLHELGDLLGARGEDLALLEEYGRLHEQFEMADGYSLDARTEAALLGLGFEMKRLDQEVQTLSGGQKRRAALAALILAPFDVLLIDEPTNHLDLEAREWLEEHLSQRKGALISISHDRAFLDRTSTHTLHLITGRLNRYAGGYTKFARQWDEQKSQWEEQYRRQREHIAKTEAFIRKNIAGQRTNQAKSRRKQLDRLDRIEAPPNEGRRLRIRIEPARESASLAFEAYGLSKGFGELTLFEELEFQVLKGDKIGVLGPNGTGKTTLLRLLTREYAPISGRLVRGQGVDLGYYDQDLRLVSDANTVLREIHQMDPTMSEGDVRSLLGAFAFDEDMIQQPVATLSGGERARLSLLKLILERHNTLLLDEPTNHLDTDTREALEEALQGFSGTLIVVSHDRYFLNRICNRIFAFEGPVGGGPGGLRQFLGNYDDYREHMAKEREKRVATMFTDRRAAASEARAPGQTSAGRRREVPVGSTHFTAAGSPPRRKRDLSKNELRKLRVELHDLEEEIALLEADIELASESMSSGRLSAEEMGQSARRTQKLQQTLEAKMARWEELSILLERDVGGAS